MNTIHIHELCMWVFLLVNMELCFKKTLAQQLGS